MQFYLLSVEIRLNIVTKIGYHNPKISELLCISEHTTKAHLASIYEKLHVTNRIKSIILLLLDYMCIFFVLAKNLKTLAILVKLLQTFTIN